MFCMHIYKIRFDLTYVHTCEMIITIRITNTNMPKLSWHFLAIYSSLPLPTSDHWSAFYHYRFFHTVRSFMYMEPYTIFSLFVQHLSFNKTASRFIYVFGNIHKLFLLAAELHVYEYNIICLYIYPALENFIFFKIWTMSKLYLFIHK